MEALVVARHLTGVDKKKATGADPQVINAFDNNQ